MGLIISRFRRKKTTLEILERLESDINSIEQDRQCKEQTHKRIVGLVMAYSIGLYIIFAVLFYIYSGRSQNWMNTLQNAYPLILLPILVIFFRFILSWYYKWMLNKNNARLNKMRQEKKKILEDVMNTETYKVAKEILEKFGCPEENTQALKPYTPPGNVRGNGTTSPQVIGTPVQQLRQRQIAMHTSTPIRNNNMNLLALPNVSGPFHKGARLRSDQLPRPLLGNDRSAFDKVVDYLMKDGPNHRMALICTRCYSHNGMAMAEEFEYVSYVCAYCSHMNPARKQRPAAPVLNTFKALPDTPRRSINVDDGGGDDSSVAESASDSDDDNKMANNGKIEGLEVESDRPPSPLEEGQLKSAEEKKED